MHHEGCVAFIQLLAVGKQRGWMLHVASGWSRAKRPCLCLGTFEAESLNLDSSCHMKAHNRTSELAVLPPRTWLPQPLGRNSVVFTKPPFRKLFSYNLLKVKLCIFYNYYLKLRWC